jgi:hypothetical protein
MAIRHTVYEKLSFTKAQNVAQLMRATGLTERQVRGSIELLRLHDGIFVAQVGTSNGGWYLRDEPAPTRELGHTRWKVGPPERSKRSARP